MSDKTCSNGQAATAAPVVWLDSNASVASAAAGGAATAIHDGGSLETSCSVWLSHGTQSSVHKEHRGLHSFLEKQSVVCKPSSCPSAAYAVEGEAGDYMKPLAVQNNCFPKHFDGHPYTYAVLNTGVGGAYLPLQQPSLIPVGNYRAHPQKYAFPEETVNRRKRQRSALPMSTPDAPAPVAYNPPPAVPSPPVAEGTASLAASAPLGDAERKRLLKKLKAQGRMLVERAMWVADQLRLLDEMDV